MLRSLPLRPLAGQLLALAVFLRPGAAPAQSSGETPPENPPPVQIDGGRITVATRSGPRTLELPCTPISTARLRDTLYLSCGGRELWQVQLTDEPALAGPVTLDGEASHLFVRGDQVWVLLARLEARPLEQALAGSGAAAAPGGDTPAAPPRARPAAAPAGRVIGQGISEVIVDLGEKHGLQLGSKVQFLRRQAEFLGGGAAMETERSLAVGEVTALAVDRSTVRLGINEIVPTGSTARPTDRPATEARALPPRASDIWQLRVSARPFLALGHLGAGALAEAEVGFRAASKLHVALGVAPMSFAITDEKNLFAIDAGVVVGYDDRLFEVGLGAGILTVNDPASSTREPGPGISIIQLARLGAHDGFSFEVRNSFVAFEGQFMHGNTRVQVQIPLLHRAWLILRGGGGRVGHGHGDAGLRLLLRGNGGPGSLFFTPAVGGDYVFGSRRCSEYYCDVSYGGPMIGADLEWRL